MGEVSWGRRGGERYVGGLGGGEGNVGDGRGGRGVCRGMGGWGKSEAGGWEKGMSWAGLGRRGPRAEGRRTNGRPRKASAAHINIINTSRHPAIRPRLPLFSSPLPHRLLFVLAFAYPITAFYLYIIWSRVMAAAQGETAVRAPTLAGNLSSALIRRGIIGMISVRRTIPESNFLNNRRGCGAAPALGLMDGGGSEGEG